MANRRVALIRTVKIDGKWKYLAPVVSEKGRISPEFVVLDGKPTRVSGGIYYISWYVGRKSNSNVVGRR